MGYWLLPLLQTQLLKLKDIVHAALRLLPHWESFDGATMVHAFTDGSYAGTSEARQDAAGWGCAIVAHDCDGEHWYAGWLGSST